MDAPRFNPYVGPRTFNKNERDRFYGRDREARELLSLVVSEQLVIFYAQSGAGKSSLVNTCLIPDLEKKNFQVLPVARVLGDAPVGMPVKNIFAFNLMRSLAPVQMTADLLAHFNLGEFFKNIKIQLAASSGGRADSASEGMVLIVDQFEEIFSTHNDQWESREDFFRQLTRAMRANPELWVLLVMREDFIASLDSYAHLLHERGRIRYYMQRLEREAALKAIQRPVEQLRPYEESVAERLFDDLCSIKVLGPDGKTLIDQPGQYVEPVQMQVVCYNLWENLGAGTTITAADLAKVGDVDAALGNYYAARVKGVAETKKVSERHIRDWIEQKLIASGGIRNQVLQERVTPPGGLDDEVIQALQSDLIRSEKRGASTFYELTHDRLVEPILENNKLWFSEKLSPLQRQAALWLDKGRKDDWLSTGQALADIEAWAKQYPDDLSEVDREFLEESRAYQRQLDERQRAQARELEMSRKFAEEQALANQRIRKALRTSTIIAVVATLFLGLSILLGIESFQNQRETQMNILINASAEALANKDTNLATLLAYQALITYSDEYGQAESALGNIVKPIQNSPEKVPYFVGDYQTGNITALAVSTDGTLLVAGDADGVVTLWDLQSSTELGDLNIFGGVADIALSPDSRTLAVVGTTSNINIWDVSEPSSPAELTILMGHKDRVNAIAFSPDGRLLASASSDQTVSLWDMSAPAEAVLVATFSGHTNIVWDVAFSPDGASLASSSEDGTIILWDVRSLIIRARSVENGSGLLGLAFSPDGKTLVSGGQYNKIIFLSAADLKLADPIEEAIYMGRDLAFNPDGSILVIDGFSTSSLWNADSLSPLHADLSFSSNASTFAPDGKLLLGSSEGVVVWDIDLDTPEQVETLKKSDYGGVARVHHLSLLPDGKSLFVMGLDDLSHIMSIGNAEVRPFDIQFSTSWDGTPNVVFSANRRYVAAVNDDYQVTVRDRNANKDVAQWGFYGGLKAISPDGKYVVSSTYGGDVTVRDANTGQEVSVVNLGEDSSPTGITLSSDGKYLALAGTAKNILVWEVETGNVLYRIPRTGSVSYMAFSPDRTRLAVALNDDKRSVEVWDLDTQQLILLIEDSELKRLDYAVGGGFNLQAQEVPQPQEEQEDPILGNVSKNLSNIIGLAYTEAGLVVLHQNGVLDQWTIWPGRSELLDYAQGQCDPCALSYAQRVDYGLYTWHMWVQDFAGYFIFLLNLACCAVCIRFGYRGVFSTTAIKNVKTLSDWKAFWRASWQGFVLLIFSLLVWVAFTYVEVFKYPDASRNDGFEALWFTLPLGLWAGGVYSHYTRGQVGKWSLTKRSFLGVLAGILAGVFSVSIGLIAFIYAETWHLPKFRAEIMSNSESLSYLGMLFAIGVGTAGLMSLLGAWFHMFWLVPWSEGKTSPVADWFRHKVWMHSLWKRSILIFVVSTILGIVSLSIWYGNFIDKYDLPSILIISVVLGIFGFLFHPQRSSYIWMVVFGVIGTFLFYQLGSPVPIALWLGLGSGFALSAALSHEWKRGLFVLIAGAILLSVNIYLESGSISADSDLPIIVLISIALAGFGRIFYPHKISYIVMLVLGIIGIYPWYLVTDSVAWAISLGLGSGFILSAIISRILHTLKKI